MCLDGMRRCRSHRKSSFDAFCVGSKFLLLPVLERRRILHEVFFHPPFSPDGVLQSVRLLLRGDAYERVVRGTREGLSASSHIWQIQQLRSQACFSAGFICMFPSLYLLLFNRCDGSASTPVSV